MNTHNINIVQSDIPMNIDTEGDLIILGQPIYTMPKEDIYLFDQGYITPYTAEMIATELRFDYSDNMGTDTRGALVDLLRFITWDCVPHFSRYPHQWCKYIHGNCTHMGNGYEVYISCTWDELEALNKLLWTSIPSEMKL